MEYATSIAEIYRERGEWTLLAMHYNGVKNYELRDKYIDIALKHDSSDQTVCFLRGIQGRPELIPQDVIDRESKRYTSNKDWSQRARFFRSLGRYRDAAEDYVRTALESLQQGNTFGAAYYLRELYEHDLVTALYVAAMQSAASKGDLWWQIRALQDLGWDSELKAFLLGNAKEIKTSGNPLLLQLLARAEGDQKVQLEVAKALARGTSIVVYNPSPKTTNSSGKHKNTKPRNKRSSTTPPKPRRSKNRSR